MSEISQPVQVFDGSERVYIERPAEICLVSIDGAPIDVFVEVWDVNQRTLGFTPNAGGAKVGAVRLSVTSVGSSLAWLAQQLYNAVNPTNPVDINVVGLPPGAVGGVILVDPDAAEGRGVAVNAAGTADGSVGAGAGIANGRGAPVFFGPRIVLVGGTLYFGGFAQ